MNSPLKSGHHSSPRALRFRIRLTSTRKPNIVAPIMPVRPCRWKHNFFLSATISRPRFTLGMVAPMKRAALFALLLLVSSKALAHRATEDIRIPVTGSAPEFALIDQRGAPFALADMRGKVVVVTFFYTTCNQHCPLLTEKLASLQTPLGADFGPLVRFVSISIDPKVDTPQVLLAYARKHDANLAGWSFLTGTASAIEQTERAYGAQRTNYRLKTEHLFVTTIIDQHGILRVKYVGAGFIPEQLLQDVQKVLRE